MHMLWVILPAFLACIFNEDAWAFEVWSEREAIRKPGLVRMENLANFTKPNRPFRNGIIKLNPEFDLLKPLGAGDFAGWVLTAGKIIGNLGTDLVGALKLESSEVKWRFPSKGGLSIPPVLYGNSVFLASMDGYLRRLDVESGKTEWEVKLDSFCAREIKIHDDAIYAVSATQSLYSIEPENGHVRWSFDGGNLEDLAVRNVASPTVHDGVLYYGLSNGEIAAVNTADGKLRWRHNPYYLQARFKDSMGELRVFNQQLLFARYDGVVLAVDLFNPSKLAESWSSPLLLNSVTSVKYIHGRLVVGTANGYVYRIDAGTGKEKWRQALGQSVAYTRLSESYALVVTSNGLVSMLDINSGNILWSDFLDANILGPPVYVAKTGTLYIATANKVLYGYRI